MKTILLISTIYFMLYTSPVFPQEILFQDDFESYKTGTFPSSPWYLAYNGSGEEYQMIVNDQFVSPTQSIHLECAPGWAAHAHFVLPKTPTIIYCEVDMMLENLDDIAIVGFGNPDVGIWGEIYGSLQTRYNGYFYSGLWDDQILLGRKFEPFEIHRWYHVKVKYNSHLDLCDVWIDSELKGQNIKCATIGEYYEFYISIYNKPRSSQAWFDNVIVYADSLIMMLHSFYTGAYLYLNDESDSALAYFKEAMNYLDVNQGIPVNKYLPVSYFNYLHNSTFQVDSTLIYKRRAFDWYSKNGFLFMAMYTSSDLISFYLMNNQLNLAEKQLHQSEKIYNEMIKKNSWYRQDSIEFIAMYGEELYYPLLPEHMKEMMWSLGKSMYYRLYQIHQAKKSTEKALEYHIAYSKVMDTLSKFRLNNETNELLSRSESKQKRENQHNIFLWLQEIYLKSNKLEQTRLYLFALGMLVFFIVLLAVVFVRQNKLRNEQQNLLLQQKLFRSQMNPHFIFNSLTSIQNFILDEEPGKASKYLSRFSKLVRHILDSSVEENVTLQEEISTIENYLELQKIRFQDKFDYTIEVDKAIHPEHIIIPPMLAQPFIENSIEHGIKHRKTKGNIIIRFTLKNGTIVFEVEDDGVGREKAKEILFRQNKDHKSLATAITMERIRVINKKMKQKIKLQILDLKDSANNPLGTKVQMEIPWIA